MSLRATLILLVAIGAFGQAPQTAPLAPAKIAPPPAPKGKDPAIRYVENGSGVVAVNPAQPYRPIPVGVVAPRDSIFGFYLRVLNPHQINWGTEIDRILGNLSPALDRQSVLPAGVIPTGADRYSAHSVLGLVGQDAPDQVGCG